IANIAIWEKNNLRPSIYDNRWHAIGAVGICEAITPKANDVLDDRSAEVDGGSIGYAPLEGSRKRVWKAAVELPGSQYLLLRYRCTDGIAPPGGKQEAVIKID